MNCKKCKKEIPENSKFCNHCGAKQDLTVRGKRGNGQGCAYKSSKGKWIAEVTLGYDSRLQPDGTQKLCRKKATKTSFNTKKPLGAATPSGSVETKFNNEIMSIKGEFVFNIVTHFTLKNNRKGGMIYETTKRLWQCA